MPTSLQHPSSEQLREFVLGRLPATDSLRLENHVGQCTECCTRLAACNADADPLVAWLKQANPATQYAGDGDFLATINFDRILTEDDGTGTTTAPGFLGRYEIIGELGRGGMGVVYKARDTKLKRLVAIKMMRNSIFDDKDSLPRFHAEALAVARLRHPHIVQLYEEGEEEGSPYLVLEYLDGGSLADVQGAMKPKDAAALVQKLAEAVEHAHAEGVIHRDLKPGNVLLSRDGMAKITDFGLVKFDPRMINASLPRAQTTAGFIVGTPRYMSPEQASGKPGVVGPATDIYSLGAILYELLTDFPPFAELINPLEIVQTLQEREPDSPRRYCPDLPRDLEVICQKCLSQEPHRRYATAGDLAAELGRFLRGESIQARPLSLRQKVGRWCGRNPIIAGLLCGLVAVILISLAGVTWLYLDADAERQRAEQKEQQALAFAREADRKGQEALREKTEADKQRREALEYFNVARQAIETFQKHVITDPQLQLADFRPFRTILLESTIRYQEALTRRHSDDPQLQLVQAKAYFQLGALRQELGDHDAALAAYGKAVEISLRLTAKEPVQREARRATAEAKQARALLLAEMGKPSEALTELDEAMAVQEQLAKELPTDQQIRSDRLSMRGNYANVLESAGRFAESIEMMRTDVLRWEELVASTPTMEHRLSLATMYHNLGMRLEEAQPEAALHYAQRAYQLRSQLRSELPQDLLLRRALGDACLGLGPIYLRLHRFEEARTVMLEGHQLFATMVKDHPSMLEYRLKLGAAACNVGNVLTDMDEPKQALPFFNQAVSELEAVLARDKRLTTAREFLVISRNHRARALERLGRYADALIDREAILKLKPTAETQMKRARTLILSGRIEEGISATEQAMTVDTSPYRRWIAAGLFSLAAEKKQDQPEVAARYLEESLWLLQALAKEGFLQQPKFSRLTQTHDDFAAVRRHKSFQQLLPMGNKKE